MSVVVFVIQCPRGVCGADKEYIIEVGIRNISMIRNTVKPVCGGHCIGRSPLFYS